MGIFRKKTEPVRSQSAQAEEFETGRVYDYSTPESRTATAAWLFEQAKNERTAIEAKWVKCEDYYNFSHDAAKEMADAFAAQGLEWTPACVPDPYIMVESQIVANVPQPQFNGRDEAGDAEKAREREMAVRYIMEANRINDLNTSNERRLRKLGDAFWKAYYDETMPFGAERGNIRIRDVSPMEVYPDPTAGEAGLQEGEYVAYLYSMHKLKFWRTYRKELERLGVDLEALVGKSYRMDSDLLAPYTDGVQAMDDEVQILEFWFRQPQDTEEASAGAVACSVQAGGYELRYIPNYWKKTGGQCELFPFVHYWCLRDETQFWNRSEIEPILPLVDAADRELAIGQFNDAMTANDVVVVEDGALMPGEEFTNVPGSVVKVKQGRGGGVSRLGGLHSGARSLGTVEWLQGQIQRTNRNYDSNTGGETARVTTASGLLQLRTDAEAQQKIKRADRDAGFCRLYELLDYLALEFFDDDRMLVIGAEKKEDPPASIRYNSANYAATLPEVRDVVSGEVLREEKTYFPRIDVSVTAGDGFAQNPVLTMEVLDKLAATNVTADNWKLLAAELDIVNIPQKADIIEQWRRRFAPVVPQEVLDALETQPELLEAVMDVVAEEMAERDFAKMQSTPQETDVTGTVPLLPLGGTGDVPAVGL